MNRLIAVFALFTTSFSLWGATIPLAACQGQTFNFVDPYNNDVLATLVLFDLPANDISDFGEFTQAPGALLDIGRFRPLTFETFSGELELVDGGLRSTNGNSSLFTNGDLDTDLSAIFFPFGSDVAEFSVLTFGIEGRFVLAVPEPSSGILIACSALSIGLLRRRTRLLDCQ